MSESNTTQSTNIRWHQGEVSKRDRESARGHRGVTLWFTGLSGSGKSTLANRVERRLFERGCATYVLDGDNVRYGLNRDLTFAPEDRKENIRRIGEVARLFTDAGTLLLTAFISPYRADRDAVRGLHADGDFVEVHVATPLAVCEARDPKGLYQKARAGEIANLTGIGAPYEAPLRAEVTVDTSTADVDACAAQVIAYLESSGVVANSDA